MIKDDSNMLSVAIEFYMSNADIIGLKLIKKRNIGAPRTVNHDTFQQFLAYFDSLPFDPKATSGVLCSIFYRSMQISRLFPS